MKKITNARLSRRTPQADQPVDRDFRLYEQLPPPIRHTIRELAQRMSADDVTKVYNLRGLSFTVWALGEQERMEIKRFANDYRKLTGQEYPFIAASATIQRYESGYRPRRRRQIRLGYDEMKVPDAPRRRRIRGRRQ